MKPDIGNEELRAQLKTLQYEIESYKQEKELTTIRHEKELREVQVKAEADFKRAQASESSKHVASLKYETLARDLKELQDNSTDRERVLEKKLRATEGQNRSLTEEVEEARTELEGLERQYKHRLQEIEKKNATLQQTVNEVQTSFANSEAALELAQQKLSQRESDIGALESEALKLKAQSGDVEELATVKRELTDQVAHIRKLEVTNREQTSELRHLRQVHKAVGVVEEEKRGLELKVQRMGDLERELGEAKIQRTLLEDERNAWTSYLQNSSSDGAPEFESPEAMARALAQERLEKASLLDNLGKVQPELSEKEAIISSLESERTKLQTEIEKLKTSTATTGGSSDLRAKARLERQKALAVKEVEYLRDQLRTFEAEDVTGEVPITDAEQTLKQRISSLEDLVSQYRNEIQTLHTTISSLDSQPPAATTIQTRKRTRDATSDDTSNEQVGELTRKNRKLQSEIESLTKKSSSLTNDLSATKSQLSTLQESAKTRVLSLRSNPTSDFENLKYSMISTLREENTALMEKLKGSRKFDGKTVPLSSFTSACDEIEELKAIIASKEKTTMRLKQVWSLKSLEFREAVASILGWKMDFLPNGRFRLTSLFNLPLGDEGEGENSLIFNGETGEMKISGGQHGEFGREVKGLVKYWVEERKEVPAFMAACTIEFYERTTRALRM